MISTMSVLPLAPFPPFHVRKSITATEWDSCIDAWLLLTQAYLALPSQKFAAGATQGSSLVAFLDSYTTSISEHRDISSSKAKLLSQRCFFLIHRVFKEIKDVPSSFLEIHFLSNMSLVFLKSNALRKLLDDVWQRYSLENTISILKRKAELIARLGDTKSAEQLEPQIARIVAFSHNCFHFGQFLMIGSDFIDALVSSFDLGKPSVLKEQILKLAYITLVSLMNGSEPKIPSLLDHLYGLNSTSLLKALVENTPFANKFERCVSNPGRDSGRAVPLLQEFSKYKRPKRPTKRVRKTANKGKDRAINDAGFSAEIYVHKMSLVTQIQDLFPELGSGFIIKLLGEYNDDTEQIIAHLLDDSLPQYLRTTDRQQNFEMPTSFEDGRQRVQDLVPRRTPSPPPTRRNIYDNDDFDNLAINTSKLHLGRKHQTQTADSMLEFNRPTDQKAAILSALAAFDSDDDERDDTYDVEDVGGTVDTTYADDETHRAAAAATDKNDEALYMAYRADSAVFKRDADTRRSKARTALKNDLGMTDEAIEGWGIMIIRDPARRKRLERAFDMGKGSRQNMLEATAWRAERDSGTEEAEGTEDSDVGGRASGTDRGASQNRGRDQGRGPRGRGRGGRGDVSGPTSDRDTQVARQRKDASKGSRANHNRRDQRARKMARGGFAG